MAGMEKKVLAEKGQAPDLLRYYRPVAIRSVVAAHAMIPRQSEPPVWEPQQDAGFALPSGFHSISED